MRKFFKFKYSFFWACFIFFLCAIPGNDLPKVRLFPNFDKLVHFGMYFCLQTILLLEYRRYKIIRSDFIIITVTICTFFGVVIELLQGWFFINRTASFWDALANFAGILAALLFSRIYSKKHPATAELK